jgi:hypothetical protein
LAVQQVRTQIDGQWYTLTYNAGTGKYTATITAPNKTSFNQPGGYYPVTVEATDDHGNTVTDSSAQLIVKEVTKPVINITSPTAGAFVTNNKQPIMFTLRDEANGSGIKLSTLALKIDGGDTIGSASPGMTCTPVTNGYDCTYVPPTAISDGGHTVTINVADNDGNTATQKSVNYTIDTIPPTLSVSAPADNLKTNLASCTVMGTTNDATSSPVTITIKLNDIDQGAISVDGSGNFSKTVNLTTGTNTIVVKATDAAGKFTEVTRTVSLNTTAPVISNVVVTPNPANVTTSITISCTVIDS